MDPNNNKTIESFVKGFEEVAEIIKDRNPDLIIAPMFGAVPFIDILNIVDDEFPNNKVEYVPASNKVHRLRDVLRGVFKNLINAYTPVGGSFLSIDEVVSGNSLVRVFKQFDAARMQYANEKTKEMYGENADFRDGNVCSFKDSILNSINYNSIGIVDSKMKRLGKKMNGEYNALVENEIVIPVDVDCIVTMDKTDFFPARYKTDVDSENNTIYLPVVGGFDVSSHYVDFLKEVAEIVGKDPNSVTVSNLGKIRSSYIWVPEELRKV